MTRVRISEGRDIGGVPLDLIATLPAEFMLKGRARAGAVPEHTFWDEATDDYFEMPQIELL